MNVSGQSMWFAKCGLAIGVILAMCANHVLASPPAVIAFDNLSATSDGTDPVANASAGGSGPLAQSFTTGNAAFDLVDLALVLGGTPTDSGSISIEVVADNGLSPSSTVVANFGTFLDSSLTLSPVVHELTLGSAVLLAADTRYWVEVSADPTTSAAWSYSTDLSGSGVSTEYTFNNYNIDDTPGVADASGGLYQMCVSDTAGACTVFSGSSGPSGPQPPSPPASGNPVPEPTTLVLLAAGLVGLGAVRRGRAASRT